MVDNNYTKQNPEVSITYKKSNSPKGSQNDISLKGSLEKTVEDSLKSTYSHPATQKINEVKQENQGYFLQQMKHMTDAMIEGGAVDENGNVSYQKLDDINIAKKVGQIAEKKEWDMYTKGVDRSEAEVASFLEGKTGRPYGTLTRTLMEQGSAYSVEQHFDQIQKAQKRVVEKVAVHHFRDIGHKDLENYLGKPLQNIPSQDERTQIAAGYAINSNNNDVVNMLAKKYIKDTDTNYKQAA